MARGGVELRPPGRLSGRAPVAAPRRRGTKHRTKRGHGRGARAGWGGTVGRILLVAAFFQITSYGWLLFRARSFGQIADFTHRIAAGAPGLTLPEPPPAAFVGIAPILAWDVAVERSGDVRFYERWPLVARAALWATMIYALAFGATTASSAFIHFQF